MGYEALKLEKIYLGESSILRRKRTRRPHPSIGVKLPLAPTLAASPFHVGLASCRARDGGAESKRVPWAAKNVKNKASTPGGHD